MNIILEAKTNNEKIIKDYLENNASETLSEKINNGNKTLQGCWNYIVGEARKKAIDNCAYIEDKEVFGWAIHYFEEDSIKENEINKVQPKVDVSSKDEKRSKTEMKSKVIDMQISLFDIEGNNDKKTEEDKK